MNKKGLTQFCKDNLNKIVAVGIINVQAAEICILIGYDKISLYLKNSAGEELIFPFSAIMFIGSAKEGAIKAFHEHVKKYKEDPEYDGQDDKDKGYTIIKRRKAVQ